MIEHDLVIDGQGHSLTPSTGGILLNANLTLKNVDLMFPSAERNAIMANGYTLTLENVTASGQPVNLFGGGASGLVLQGGYSRDLTITPGPSGQITVKNSSLRCDAPSPYDDGLTNIYAGSISTDGQPITYDGTVYNGPVGISVQNTTGLDSIYACGALQTPTFDDWFSFASGKKVDPPTPSASRFPVKHAVTITTDPSPKSIDGETGGAGGAFVVFGSTSQYAANVPMRSLGSLTVSSGVFAPQTLTGDNMDVAIASGATLRLYDLKESLPTVRNFTSSGVLGLDSAQSLSIGSVSGTTSLIFNGSALLDHAYIRTNSQTGFSYASGARSLTYDSASHAWVIQDSSGKAMIRSMEINSPVARGQDLHSTNYSFVAIPVNFDFAGTEDATELKYSITAEKQGSGAGPVTSTTIYEGGYPLQLCSNVDGPGASIKFELTYENDLSISGYNSSHIPEGIYNITLTILAESTAQGTDVSRTVQLTIYDTHESDTSPGKPTEIEVPIQVSVPSGKTLEYNGSTQAGVDTSAYYTISGGSAVNAGTYTATLSLVAPSPSGNITYKCAWPDGSTGPKTVSWQIREAPGPDAPTGLVGIAPASAGANGKILGTSTGMEYSASADFSGAVANCAANETPVAPGTYYVRKKLASGYANHTTNAARVIVHSYTAPLTVTAIAIKNGRYKTTYAVGEPLDTTGLAVTVTMSDGSRHDVDVTPSMIDGFDSSAAAGSQTLTIRYSIPGSETKTAAYTIRIQEPGSGGGSGLPHTLAEDRTPVRGRLFLLLALLTCLIWLAGRKQKSRK